MSATKTLAFVLKTMDYRDTSLIAHLYTRDFGKVHGILRGVKDGRHRYGSTLEPFSLNEILFYKRRRGADLHQVTAAELQEMFWGIRSDLDKTAHAAYMAELIDAMCDNEDSNPELFDLLWQSLTLMEEGASARRAARIFEVKFLQLQGVMPEIDQCLRCDKAQPDPAYFSVLSGGLLCQSCLREKADEAQAPTLSAAALALSKGSLSFLQHVKRTPVKLLKGVKVSQEVGAEVERVLRRFVDFQLPNKLKSVIFLEKLTQEV